MDHMKLLTLILTMSAFQSAAYIQVHFRLDFFTEANIMNPIRLLPKEQPDLGHDFLPYWLPKSVSRRGFSMLQFGLNSDLY